MLVQLLNLTRTPLTLVLPHADVCSDERCLCADQLVGTNTLDPASGELTLQSRSVRMPSSLQLFGKGRPGDRSGTLPAGVLRAPDVARAMRAHAIKVIEIEEPAVPTAPPTAEPPAQATNEEASSTLAEQDGGDVTEQPARRGRQKER